MDLLSRPIGELSGGQRQRVLQCPRFGHRTQDILMDEPTASVDPQFKNSIFELLQGLINILRLLWFLKI
jgi:ABC-type Mn2+/Zn2+ transport system ATPase subunit